ncbi:MAG TPA: hypothetical protein VNI84_14500 [Pyrinomonadaceae bacterium]|nr:hypothetical protein [Pyrinomonadaceae bacterium]
MEIFIVGLVVVALMVFVSTKIKASAAQAFEPERIEKKDFIIIKPRGFMTPVEANSGFAFEAYSRDTGEKKMRNTRQAEAFLTTADGLNFAAECEKARKTAVNILSERVLGGADGEKVCLIETEGNENDFPTIDFWKIVESRKLRKTFALKVSVLKLSREIYIHEINEMVNGFRLK